MWTSQVTLHSDIAQNSVKHTWTNKVTSLIKYIPESDKYVGWLHGTVGEQKNITSFFFSLIMIGKNIHIAIKMCMFKIRYIWLVYRQEPVSSTIKKGPRIRQTIYKSMAMKKLIETKYNVTWLYDEELPVGKKMK